MSGLGVGLGRRACAIAPQQRQPLASASASSRCSPALPARRRAVAVRAEGNWWEKITGGGNKEDAARRAIQDSFNSKKFGAGQQPPGANPKQPPGASPKQTPNFKQPSPASGSGGGFGGMFGSGGQGGGGGGGWGGGAGAGDGPDVPEQPILQEFLALMKGIWMVFWNTAIFLGFAYVLHTSLDWCCQIELLLLVGAPQQAWERVLGVLYSHVESFEKNVLGWDIPQDDDKIPMYENIALYFPEEHAYTFDSYRYPVTESEKRKLKHFHALRHYERDGGYKGEVDAQDVQAIQDKYEPMEADRRAYRAAKMNGTLAQYWEDKKEVYKKYVRPDKWL